MVVKEKITGPKVIKHGNNLKGLIKIFLSSSHKKSQIRHQGEMVSDATLLNEIRHESNELMVCKKMIYSFASDL